ncbi:MAG TPA: hypothetical protein VG843_06885 [Rhizomicrobium sp.]|jgi:hypothetical protein|nr:hypothetical protein [Rhizomicrobium sp.]
MLGKITGAGLFLLALSQPAAAQSEAAQSEQAAPLPTPRPIQIAAAQPLPEPFDASVARLAAKAAFQPQAQPTREELLRVILLMSIRERRASGT